MRVGRCAHAARSGIVVHRTQSHGLAGLSSAHQAYARTRLQTASLSRHRTNAIRQPALWRPAVTSIVAQTKSFQKPSWNDDPTTYVSPTKGLLSLLPRAMVPYAELSRLDKPAGTAYLLMPCFFSTLMAACAIIPLPSAGTLLYTSTLFTLGATTMRGAGCTINDLWDRNLDKHVARTKLRPLARGAVSVPGAITWFCAQSLVGLIVLLQFPINAVLAAIPSMVLVCTYPLAKRVTQYPQFVLGMAFSWGAVLGFPALGGKLIDFGIPLERLKLSLEGIKAVPSLLADMHVTFGDANLLASAGLLYASCITWTLLYDTIYAFQDIKDDRKIGIKSTAQAFSTKSIAADLIDRKPKAVLTGLAIVQSGLLAASGYALGLSPVFFTTACTGSLATALLMARTAKLNDVHDCAWWFKMGCWITGSAICGGTLLEYAAHMFRLTGG